MYNKDTVGGPQIPLLILIYGIPGSDHPVANAHMGLNEGLAVL